MNQQLYEVTVPLVVTVAVNEAGAWALSGKIDNGWPGFFSEAEEAGGVWSPDDGEWVEHDDVNAAAFRWAHGRLENCT
jgi:hypothetical protein